MSLQEATSQMISESSVEPKPLLVNLFTAADVAGILRERGWLQADDAEAGSWIADAVALLGPRAANREALGELLAAIFEYDAHAILSSPENHAILAREGSREVLRALAGGDFERRQRGFESTEGNRLRAPAGFALWYPRHFSSPAAGPGGPGGRR